MPAVKQHRQSCVGYRPRAIIAQPSRDCYHGGSGGRGEQGGQVAGYTGLREFLALLEREGELARVGVPVALDQELGAICVRSLRNGGPALFFQRPGGQDVPILVNLLATRRRYGLALGCTPGKA